MYPPRGCGQSPGINRGGHMPDKPDTQRIAAKFNGVKIFSATMAHDREMLGEKLTQWLRQNPRREVVDTVVTQSSDEAFHCLAITVFYLEER